MSREPIANPKRRDTLLVSNGSTGDIIKSLMRIADLDYQAAQVSEFAQRFKGSGADDQYQKLKELWKYTRREIQYAEDQGGQFIKDPGRVYWDNKKGIGTDCKSLSLFEYSVCRAIGVPCYFEFVSFFSKWEDGKQRITHVYPVAIVAGQDVVLDAVYSKFDERPPGITRLVKKYTKVFNSMADIYHIAGLKGTPKGQAQPTAADLASELKDRAKLVKPTSYVDYSIMSDGEMHTFLLAQRDKMLAEFYTGTPQGAMYAQAFAQKRDALYRGLHTGFNLLAPLGLGAKSRTRPASGWLTWQERGFTPKTGLKELFDDAENGAVRGIGVVIPQLDCNTLFPVLTLSQWTAQGAPESVYFSYVQDQQAKRAACAIENKWRASLNTYWMKSSLTLLYNFLPQNSSYYSGIDQLVIKALGRKEERHRDAFNGVQGGSKISAANMRQWLENGVTEQSIIAGLGPQTGKGFIDGLKDNADVAINGFVAALAKVAINQLKHTWNQFQLFVGVVKGDLSMKEAVKAHINSLENFFVNNSDEIEYLASNKDFKNPGPCLSNADCPTGFHCEGDTCVPDDDLPPGGGNGGGNGSGFSIPTPVLIGGGLVAAALLFGGKK